ncbi:ABC transporter ATP-binding protein [Crocinitomicaceae bacterium]|nr:ABC transporter ATP-binding protein [Crocinitomicaceae bacterium]
MNAIETHNLTKLYGEHVGMKDVSLEIKEGEVFGFVGPNGAGKSTAIRTLLGLLHPTSGSGTLFGEDITKGEKVRARIGYLPSEVNYYEEMSSMELLEYHMRFYGQSDPSKIEELAAYFELDLQKKITDLSFGNKKKCAILQSLLHDPDLLILDEPTSGLDPLMQNRFFEHLEERNKQGTTIFFSSHILSEVQRMCDRAAVIKQGEIIAIENINELMAKQVKRARITFENKKEIEKISGMNDLQWHGKKLHFNYVGNIRPLIDWMQTQDLQDVTLEEPDLETIFMNYYER